MSDFEEKITSVSLPKEKVETLRNVAKELGMSLNQLVLVVIIDELIQKGGSPSKQHVTKFLRPFWVAVGECYTAEVGNLLEVLDSYVAGYIKADQLQAQYSEALKELSFKVKSDLKNTKV